SNPTLSAANNNLITMRLLEAECRTCVPRVTQHAECVEDTVIVRSSVTEYTVRQALRRSRLRRVRGRRTYATHARYRSTSSGGRGACAVSEYPATQAVRRARLRRVRGRRTYATHARYRSTSSCGRAGRGDH